MLSHRPFASAGLRRDLLVAPALQELQHDFSLRWREPPELELAVDRRAQPSERLLRAGTPGVSLRLTRSQAATELDIQAFCAVPAAPKPRRSRPGGENEQKLIDGVERQPADGSIAREV